VAGMPIMPRTSVSVTLAAEQAHGAFFEGGYYQTFTPFDPVIARLVTDTATGLTEPPYAFPEWVPAAWDLVNSIQQPEGAQQRLVILPAQYSALSSSTGTMRVFEAMTYTVYYSTTEDVYPPSFWLVEDETIDSSQHITVEVTDWSGVLRVAVGYTWGDGRWEVADLARTVDNPDVWTGSIPYTETLSYFVQAVDGAGNVEVESNKARYFGRVDDEPPPGAPTATFSADVVSGTVPLAVTFTAVTSGTVEGWHWSFGDSTVAFTGPVVQHTYQIPGVFDVNLTVSNTYGSYTVNKPGYITVSSSGGGHRVYLPLVLRN